MGTIFYQIWKLSDKKDRNLMLGFLALDVFLWNLLVVPIAATQGVVLPEVTIEHILSIVNFFTGVPS
ncbi:DNA packaging ATPase [Klebsiella phage SAKp28]